MDHINNSRHGGNVYAAARALRRPIEQLVDFSASINPLGPSPRALHAITHARGVLQHYPDPDCWALRQALAARWRCRPDQIVIGNGSAELIHLLPAALHLRHLLVIGPMFSEYARAMTKSGGRVSTVLADRADGYKPPLARAMKLLRESGAKAQRRGVVDAVVLCNPNSPTGRAYEADEVMRVARLAERHGVKLIVDETFVDYCEERSILPMIAKAGRTIVLRSFTKFYGLPGLRVGYLISNAATARQIHAHQPPWSVNALAQEAALGALLDRRHAERSRSFMVRERARLTRLLEKLPGCALFPSSANFLLMELPLGHQARMVTATLYRQGLLIRDCSDVPGLNERTVRIAIRGRADNDRMVLALSTLLR